MEDSEQLVNTRDLRVGMFITLPVGWWQHPFARSSFLISSEDLLERVRSFYDGPVAVDVDRSEVVIEAAPPHRRPQPTVTRLPAATAKAALASQDVRRAVNDMSMGPPLRSRAIYTQSLRLMRAVLDQPTAESLACGKQTVSHVVDAIVAEPDVLNALLGAAQHDYSTYTHSVNVGVYAVALAYRLYGDNVTHDLRELGAAFFLHDLGMMRVKTHAGTRRIRYGPEDEEPMRAHPVLGYDMLKECEAATEECRVVALQHHERVDGSGYPEGLTNDAIHDYARICSVADVYDALVSRSTNRPPLSPYDALRVMRARMLDHFTRDVFEGFIYMLGRRRAA